MPDFYSIVNQYKSVNKGTLSRETNWFKELHDKKTLDKFYDTNKLWNTKSYNTKY